MLMRSIHIIAAANGVNNTFANANTLAVNGAMGSAPLFVVELATPLELISGSGACRMFTFLLTASQESVQRAPFVQIVLFFCVFWSVVWLCGLVWFGLVWKQPQNGHKTLPSNNNNEIKQSWANAHKTNTNTTREGRKSCSIWRGDCNLPFGIMVESAGTRKKHEGNERKVHQM